LSIRNSVLNAYGRLSVGESIASSAVKTSIDIHAKLIIVLSETGKMANYVAKFRPGIPVLCLTPNPTAARQASGLLFGLHTIMVDSLDNSEELIDEICFELTSTSMLKDGDEIIVIAGRMAATMKEQLQVVKLGGGNQSHGRIITRSESFFFNRDLLLHFSTLS
jgi:pyruvate kinase